MILCSVNQKRHCIKVETIRDVHGYVMDGVNCDTVSYLVYNTGPAEVGAQGAQLRTHFLTNW